MVEKVLITGGAGFIGSHIVESLLNKGNYVVVIDNLSTGSEERIENHLKNPRFKFHKVDLLGEGIEKYFEGVDSVFHLAANPEVKLVKEETKTHIEQNVLVTYNVLEAVRKTKVKKFFFTSTSTVYGEAKKLPTPEDYSPKLPISLYGASKLACESLISAFSASFGINCMIFRLANIIGGRSTHGVIYDFVKKLKINPKRLEIFGNGEQNKSYMHVEECVRAMLFCARKQKGSLEIYNIGSEDQLKVVDIAKIVCEEGGLSSVKFDLTGGIRGWVGDVPIMILDINKLKSLGFRPSMGSGESVRLTAKEIWGGR